MEQNKREIGWKYERIAGEYLQTLGYEIIEYNYHSRNGEIDIIAKQHGYYVFIEVKYRESEKNGHPLEAVSASKQRTISKCAFSYLQRYGLQGVPVRFDVVGILGKEIRVIQNAFDFLI